MVKIPFQANLYLSKVHNRNAREKWEICLKPTIKALEQLQWRRSGVFIVNTFHIFFYMFLLLPLNRYMYEVRSASSLVWPYFYLFMDFQVIILIGTNWSIVYPSVSISSLSIMTSYVFSPHTFSYTKYVYYSKGEFR